MAACPRRSRCRRSRARRWPPTPPSSGSSCCAGSTWSRTPPRSSRTWCSAPSAIRSASTAWRAPTSRPNAITWRSGSCGATSSRWPRPATPRCRARSGRRSIRTAGATRCRARRRTPGSIPIWWPRSCARNRATTRAPSRAPARAGSCSSCRRPRGCWRRAAISTTRRSTSSSGRASWPGSCASSATHGWPSPPTTPGLGACANGGPRAAATTSRRSSS